MGIAQSVLEAVEEELRRRPGATLRAVGLRIGEISAVDPGSLSFAFECLSGGTGCESARLVVETSPWRRRCRACGREFRVENFAASCPDCGSGDTAHLGGDEIEIAWLELEQP